MGLVLSPCDNHCLIVGDEATRQSLIREEMSILHTASCAPCTRWKQPMRNILGRPFILLYSIIFLNSNVNNSNKESQPEILWKIMSISLFDYNNLFKLCWLLWKHVQNSFLLDVSVNYTQCITLVNITNECSWF